VTSGSPKKKRENVQSEGGEGNAEKPVIAHHGREKRGLEQRQGDRVGLVDLDPEAKKKKNRQKKGEATKKSLDMFAARG